MRETFVLEDLLNIMIELETFGNKNYASLAEKAADRKLSEYFGVLASMELKHKAIFEDLKASVISFEQTDLDPEYTAYLDATLKNAIRFMKVNSIGETTIDFDYGYDLAVSLEKDAILFLIEIKSLMPQIHHATIDTLIEEERSHLKFLYKYMEGESH